MRVLVIGAAVLDIAASPVGKSDTWREKQWISDVTPGTGGDAANQCIHLAALGHEPVLVSCVGDDLNAETIRTMLSARGVDTGHMVTLPDRKTGTSVILINQEGQRFIFSVPGAHRGIAKEHVPESLLDGCDAVSLASLLTMPVLEADGMREFLQKARERGIPVFGDLCAGSDDMASALPILDQIDHFLPSLYDVLHLTGTKSAEEAAFALRARGVGTAVIKCGEEGAYVLSETFTGKVAAAKTRAVDTTGCGDCMSAAYISAVLEGASTEEAVRFGCAAGTVCAEHRGASAFTLRREDIAEVLEKM